MHFEITSAPDSEDRKLIQQGVVTLVERVFKIDSQALAVLARDDAGTLIRGLIGRSQASWLSVDLIWVAEPHRRTGIGAKLMAHAEAAARERFCLGVHLHTGSFEAPGFYERLGYTMYGAIEDFPPGHRRLSFSKRFAGDTPA